MEPAIEIRNVTFKYRRAEKPSLININLTVYRGEFLGIIGPTGAGKTTLCLTMVGIVPNILKGDFTGEVITAGMKTTEHEVSEISQKVGMTMQDPESQLLMPDVEREIAFGPENLGLPRDEIRRRIDYALKVVGLGEFRSRHPFLMSGGQKQKVAVASSLAMLPEIMILDEPTSELDPIGTEEVFKTVRKLKAEGKTIVMVEHKTELLSVFSDRIIVMNEGRIIESGPTREILSDVELLKKIGVDPPQATQVAYLLKKRGINIGKFPLTVDEAVEIFSQIVRGE